MSGSVSIVKFCKLNLYMLRRWSVPHNQEHKLNSNVSRNKARKSRLRWQRWTNIRQDSGATCIKKKSSVLHIRTLQSSMEVCTKPKSQNNTDPIISEFHTYSPEKSNKPLLICNARDCGKYPSHPGTADSTHLNVAGYLKEIVFSLKSKIMTI